MIVSRVYLSSHNGAAPTAFDVIGAVPAVAIWEMITSYIGQHVWNLCQKLRSLYEVARQRVLITIGPEDFGKRCELLKSMALYQQEHTVMKPVIPPQHPIPDGDKYISVQQKGGSVSYLNFVTGLLLLIVNKIRTCPINNGK